MNKLLPILLVVVLSGCGAKHGIQSMEKITPGMSFSEVETLMGKRDSFQTRQKDGNDYTLYKYTNRTCNEVTQSNILDPYLNLKEKCNFSIIFKNGKVAEIDTFFLESSREQPRSGLLLIFSY